MLKSWTRYQHYNKPNPPWIKLYTSLLDDIEFQMLSESTRLLAFHVLMLAGKTNNKMPKNPEWLKTRFLLSEVDLDPLYAFGLIADYDSRAASHASESSPRRGEESRGERNKDGPKGPSEEFRSRSLAAEAKSILKGVPR